MWVPKVPKRYDFCGCPPCGLCYVWVGGEGKHIDDVLIDGVQKMAEDLLGRAPNAEEFAAVRRGAENLHNANLVRDSGVLDGPGGATADEEGERWTEKSVNAFLRDRRKELAARAGRKPLNTVTLDSLAEEAEEKAREKKERAKEIVEKVKEKAEEMKEIQKQAEEAVRENGARWREQQRRSPDSYERYKYNMDVAREKENRRADMDRQRREAEKVLKEDYERMFDPTSGDFKYRGY